MSYTCIDCTSCTQLTGPAMPPICGENAGQHLYLDAGANTDTSATLSVVTTGTSDERQGHCVECREYIVYSDQRW